MRCTAVQRVYIELLRGRKSLMLRRLTNVQRYSGKLRVFWERGEGVGRGARNRKAGTVAARRERGQTRSHWRWQLIWIHCAPGSGNSTQMEVDGVESVT